MALVSTVMLASTNTFAQEKRGPPPQKHFQLLLLLRIRGVVILPNNLLVQEKPFNSEEACELVNTQGHDYDERDYEDDDATALAFKGKGRSKGKGAKGGKGKRSKRMGKYVSRRPPCKFYPLGKCTKGKDCEYFHSHKAAVGSEASRNLSEIHE